MTTSEFPRPPRSRPKGSRRSRPVHQITILILGGGLICLWGFTNSDKVPGAAYHHQTGTVPASETAAAGSTIAGGAQSAEPAGTSTRQFDLAANPADPSRPFRVTIPAEGSSADTVPPPTFPQRQSASQGSPAPLATGSQQKSRLQMPPPGPAPFTPAGAGGLATQAEIDALIAGVEGALSALERDLIQQVFGDTLPVLGDALAKAATSPSAAPLHHLTGLKAAIKNGLTTLNGAPTYTKTQVEAAITAALTSAGISFGAITMDAANATDLKLSFNTTRSFPAFTSNLDAGLGIPGLGLQTSGQASTVLSYTINFSVGVDSQGFYLNTANNASAFTVAITTTVPGLDVSANLSKLRFRLTDESATDGDSVPPTQFGGTFAIDLLDPSGADNRLRIGELSTDLLDATLTANAALNLNLASDLGTANFPAISADLNFSWAFNGAPVIAGDSNATFGAVPTVAFKNVTLDLGSFFSDFAKPVLGKVRTVSEPVQPLIKAVQEPIPLLTDLNNITSYVPKSLLDMAVKSRAITQEQADNFDILAKVIAISNSIAPGAGANVKIDLGDFNLGTADPRVPDFNIGGITPNKIRNAALAALQNPLVADFLQKTGAFPKGVLPNGQPGKGMQFPILEKPETAFGLLLGKDVDLFTMDNATQNLALYKIDEFIRLAGPLGFRFKGQGDLRLDMDFGFDTRGLLDFVSHGDPVDILNGFYVLVPRNAAGQTISMAELNADMNASAAANVVLAEVGAGGRLFANGKATLADTDADGRVHLDEFIANFSESPLCVLDASGSLDFNLQAYVSVGFGPVSYTRDFQFPAGRIFDFSHACEDVQAPVLARVDSGDLKLHLGPEANRRVTGFLGDGAETFELTHRGGGAGAEEISITFSGNGGTAGGPASTAYGPVPGVIRGAGGENNDVIRLAPEIVSPAILEGNGGIDRLTGAQGSDTLSGGEERDFLYGNGGNDTLFGGPGPDVLHGGAGADLLDGGPDTDKVSFADSLNAVGINLTTGVHTNDAAGDTYLSIEQFEGTPFNDILIGDAGTNQYFGLAGNDRLEGREGDDALEGGPGADELYGGPGEDFTSYFFSPAGVNVNLETGNATGGDAEGDFLDSVEHLVGSEFNDVLTGSAANNTLAGLGGDDSISGGDGMDTIQGGEGKDTINGGAGNDFLYGEGPDTPAFDFAEHPEDPDGLLYALMQEDTIDGGEGDNYIEGGWGKDTITAGGGSDRIFGGQGADNITSGDGDDYIEGGAATDIIDAGPGDDYVKVIPDVLPPPSPNLPFPQNLPYPRFETGGLVGNGGDVIQGGAGNDTVDLSAMMCPGYYSLTQYNTFGVIVNLSTGACSNAVRECSILGFENIIGTDAADDLTGTDGPNVFDARRGGGAFTHATGGPDYINGLGGVDTLVIDFSRADLAAAPGVYTNGTDMGRVGFDRYIFSGIEKLRITGASKNDVIYNVAAGYDDVLDGKAGDDFIGGRGGSDILTGGEGNDTITANGQFNLDRYGVTDGVDVIEGGPGDDIIEDFAVQFGSGIPMIAANTILRIDGGPGRDRLSANFMNQTIPIVFNSGAPANWEFPDGAYARYFEEIDAIVTGPGADSLTQLGRLNNSFYTGAGDDVVNPGVGFDTVVGGPGNDVLIVDWSTTDDPDTGGVYYNDAYRRNSISNPGLNLDAVRLFEFERVQFTGTSKADVLFGGDDNDILIGLGGNDQLTGYGGDDRIEGGAGDDTIRTRPLFPAPGNTTILAGPGNDKVTLDLGGQPTTGYGSDSVDLGEGNDEMVWLWFDGSFGRAYALAGNIQKYDGGPGDDLGSADFGNQTEAIEFIEGQDNVIEFQDGSYFRHFEHLRYFNSGSGNDHFVFTGRATQELSCGAGNDAVDMGLGFDSVYGGPGDDTLIVNWSVGDDGTLSGAYFEPGNNSYRRQNASGAVVDQLIGRDFEHVIFTGGAKPDNVPGTNGSDVFRGNGGNDTFSGLGGDDVFTGCDPANGRGAAEIDQLTGGANNDIFVLGDANRRYYDDGIPRTPGQNGYARITDFTPGQDQLRLSGTSAAYLLGPSPIAGVAGTALFHDSNGNGTLEPASDELIATLGTAVITAANTLTPASFVNPLPLSLIAPTPLEITQTGSGADRRFTLSFSMIDPLPQGMLLEMQASADMGATDPWRTLASKSGLAAWTGSVSVTSAPPSGGRAAYMIPSDRTYLTAPRQYFRLSLSSY